MARGGSAYLGGPLYNDMCVPPLVSLQAGARQCPGCNHNVAYRSSFYVWPFTLKPVRGREVASVFSIQCGPHSMHFKRPYSRARTCISFSQSSCSDPMYASYTAVHMLTMSLFLKVASAPLQSCRS